MYMETLNEAMAWLMHETRKLRTAYDNIMSVHTDAQFQGIRLLKATLDEIEGTVKHQMEKQITDGLKREAEAERLREASVAAMSNEPPVPPVKPMPRVERYRAPPTCVVNRIHIYKEMADAILATLKTGGTYTTRTIAEYLQRKNPALLDSAALKIANGYAGYFVERKLWTDVSEEYKAKYRGRLGNGTGRLRRYRYEPACGTSIVSPESSVTPVHPLDNVHPAKPKKVYFPPEKVGRIIERGTHNRVVYEKVADHLLKSFPRGDHFTTQEVQSALEKFGYSHTSADSLAPLYTNHLIGRGIWQGTPSPGVYLAVKGLLPYTPDTETAEQKAARAEEERRAHTDMMGGAH